MSDNILADTIRQHAPTKKAETFLWRKTLDGTSNRATSNNTIPIKTRWILRQLSDEELADRKQKTLESILLSRIEGRSTSDWYGGFVEELVSGINQICGTRYLREFGVPAGGDILANEIRRHVSIGWDNGIRDVTYQICDSSMPHCDGAKSYRDVRGMVRWRCFHGVDKS